MPPEEIQIDSQSLRLLESARPGESFELDVHDGSKVIDSNPRVQITEQKGNMIYCVEFESNEMGAILVQSGSKVVSYAKGGPEIKDENTKEGFFETGKNEDNTPHYEKGKVESVTWSYDFWVVGVSQIQRSQSIG